MAASQPEGAAVAAILRQREIFHDLVDYGRSELELDRGETAAAYAQIAADYAWFNHPGLFASRRLEELLRALGRQLTPPAARTRSAERSPSRVLHVLTAAYPIGGHTRLVWRWMTADRGRSHSVVLTSQREFRRDSYKPAPRELLDAVVESGGQIFELDDAVDGILDRAQALRDIAGEFDLVVLHVHPWDAVPTIALQTAERPPAILMNHADHVFWIGAGVSDIVAHIREESATVSQRFRGLPAERTYVLPIPLECKALRFSREEAKRSLGIDDDAVVLFSAGTPHKYKAETGPHFTKLTLPVLDTHPEAILLVVGPAEGRLWDEANARTGGRVRVFGRRDDIDTFIAAADVFLNSFPLGSLTTALEAALQGVPVISYEMPGTNFIRSSDPAFADEIVHQVSAEGYVAEVSKMIGDERRRQTVGKAMREGVLRWHCGEGWKELLEGLYREIGRVGRVAGTVDVVDEREVDEVDLAVHRFHATTRWWRHFAESRVIAHARFMPPERRLVLAARTRELAKHIPPIDIRTRAHLERPRRYVAADAVFPAEWPVFLKTVGRTVENQARDLARAALARRGRATHRSVARSTT